MQFNGPLFLHPPKTGGSSIFNALVLSKIITLKDLKLEDLLLDITKLHQPFKSHNLSMDTACAVSVRCPYTRYVSLFYQFCSAQENKSPEAFTIPQFKKFMLNIQLRPTWLTSPCTNWIDGITGRLHIIKFENLVEDVKAVYGVNLNSFSRIDRTGLGTRYTSVVSEQETIKSVLKYYDDTIINFVSDIAGEDFNCFGYTKFKDYQEMVNFGNATIPSGNDQLEIYTNTTTQKR
jgi:hypothetical protein